MQKLKTAALAATAAALALAAPAAAQSALPDADPALWVVKDADTTVYLFGTVHLLDGKSEWFNDEVKTAFDASKDVFVEAILPDDPAAMQPLVMKYGIDMGTKLSAKVSPATKAKLDAATKDSPIPAAALEMMDPWLVSTMVAVQAIEKAGYKGDSGADKLIIAEARKAGKTLGELEGTEMQLKMLDELPQPVQVKMLDATLDELPKIPALIKPMMDSWAKGDAEGFAKIMNEAEDEDPELHELLLAKRNAAWAQWIKSRMEKPGTVFVAVGAGHLAGKDSVQDKLKALGIGSARVPAQK